LGFVLRVQATNNKQQGKRVSVRGACGAVACVAQRSASAPRASKNQKKYILLFVIFTEKWKKEFSFDENPKTGLKRRAFF